MKQYMPFSPVEISILTRGEAVEYINEAVSGTDKTLLLASEGMLNRTGMDKWLSETKKSGKLIHLNSIPANPSVSDVFESLKYLQGVQIDQIIAIGGGSCIDLAKAISALYSLIPPDMLSKQSVYNAIKNKEYLLGHYFIDIIALPTTSGTGSEVTKWATVWDFENKEKLSVDCVQIFPKAALLVPEFTATMTGRLTLSTGLDALSHAMESFWSRSKTPLSQAIAISAIDYVKEYLPEVLKDSSNLKLRQGMCLASLLAGLAFSITRTTASHSISYPLTLCFGVEHGLAVALTIAQVAEHNESAVPEISRIYSIFGNKDEFNKWLKDVSVPVMDLKLSTFGITERDLDFIAEKTFTQGRMDNNPIIFTKADVIDILRQAL